MPISSKEAFHVATSAPVSRVEGVEGQIQCPVCDVQTSSFNGVWVGPKLMCCTRCLARSPAEIKLLNGYLDRVISIAASQARGLAAMAGRYKAQEARINALEAIVERLRGKIEGQA
jgi:hypothetical protein